MHRDPQTTSEGRPPATTAIDANATSVPGWMVSHRVALPPRSSGFFYREELAEYCRPTSRRLTLLVAPGGFGKTTLLAERCHDALECGAAIAWLTLDGEDEPDQLDAYLAYAFEHAGLDVLEALRFGAPDPTRAYPRTALLLHAVEAYGGPFVLALDEGERLTKPSLVALFNFLLAAAPANLHVALAARELPRLLDIVTPLRGAEPGILTAEDLRFSRQDIARFFDQRLSRREVKEIASKSAGWPIALRIRRNERRQDSEEGARVRRNAVDNWVESRLWYNLGDDEIEFLLDIGLFDWFDGPLLGDVLGDVRAMERLEAMHSLDGLLRRVHGGTVEVWQFHPLIRRHCVRKRQHESPARYAAIHARIARALAARGQTVEALRHAREADDGALIADILVEAGGVRLVLTRGVDHLAAALRLVPDSASDHHPRLVPALSAAKASIGRLAEARRLLRSGPEGSPDAAAGDDLELYLDRSLARAIIAYFGCETAHTEETRRITAHAPGLAGRADGDPDLASGFEFMNLVMSNLHADFDAAARHCIRIRSSVEGVASPLAPLVEIQFGLIAMARGRVDEAISRYRSGQELAKATFLHAPRLVLLGRILLREMDLERNQVMDLSAPALTPSDFLSGADAATYFAASDIAVELALATEGVDDALAVLDGILAHARRKELPALARHLAATRVSLFADAGRVEEAERTWTEAALPDTDAGCIDLAAQSWREVESLSCARLRLLGARAEFRVARNLGSALLRLAEVHRLRRTEMRARALCMRLEHRAGDQPAAQSHLTAFIDLFEQTDYSFGLVREGDLAAAMLGRLLASDDEARRHAAADRLLLLVGRGRVKDLPEFTEREIAVLAKLHTQRDDDIADALGISRHGVRYHVQNIFRKLDTGSRREANVRARALGIIPPTD